MLRLYRQQQNGKKSAEMTCAYQMLANIDGTKP